MSTANNLSLLQAVKNLKSVPIHILETSKTGSIYAVNQMNPKGAINLTIADGMGGQSTVRLPVAKIPIDLATQATKRNIISSPQVRQLVAKEAIKFVDEEEARALLASHPEAKLEHKRLYSIGEIAEVGSTDEVSHEVQQVQAEASGDLNPFAVEMAFDTGMSEEDLLMTLRGREDELQEADFLYLVSNSKHERVKAWAAEKVNALKAG